MAVTWLRYVKLYQTCISIQWVMILLKTFIDILCNDCKAFTKPQVFFLWGQSTPMEVMKMIKSPCYWLPETEFLFILCGLVGCVCYRAWVHMQLIAFSRIFFHVVLVIFWCSNSDYKLTGFNRREVHYFSVLEVRSLESHWAAFLLEALGENLLAYLF